MCCSWLRMLPVRTTLKSITADEWTQDDEHEADVSLARRIIETVADV